MPKFGNLLAQRKKPRQKTAEEKAAIADAAKRNIVPRVKLMDYYLRTPQLKCAMPIRGSQSLIKELSTVLRARPSTNAPWPVRSRPIRRNILV